MADQAKSSTAVATKWALISVGFSIVLTYTYEFLEIGQESPARYLSLVPFVVFLFLAQKEYRDELGGFITFGKAFSTGFRFAVFAGLLGGLFVYIYLKFLSPDVYELSMQKAESDMIDKGMSDDQIEKAMSITAQWGQLIGAFFSAIGSAVIGAVISLIGAAILKKERSPFDYDDAVVTENDPTV